MRNKRSFALSEMMFTVFVIASIIYFSYNITNKVDKKSNTEAALKNVYTNLGNIIREQNYKKPVDTWGWGSGDSAVASEYILQSYILPSVKKKITCSNPLNCVGGFTSMDGEDYINYRQKTNYARAVIGKKGIHIALKSLSKCKRGNFSSLCGIVVVDIDNKDGNNKLGDDVFIFGIYGAGNFMPYRHDAPKKDIIAGCKKESYGELCAARIMNNDWKIDYWD